MEVIIALDQGSSSSRALAINERAQVVACAQFPVKTFFPRPGWVEHDAEDLAQTQERALDAVLGRLSKRTEVLGVGLACQRSTVVLWDRRTGKAVARVPSWQDARAAEVVVPLQEHQGMVHKKTGLYLTPFYSAPKMRFLIDASPSARALLDQGHLLIGPVSTYLLWRWTRGDVFCVDPSMAQRMLLFNLRQRRWDLELLSLFNLPEECLPKIIPTTGDWGCLERLGRKMPIKAVVGDQQAAAFRQGQSRGAAMLNYGTGAFFLLNTGDTPHLVPGLLASVAWQKKNERCSYFLEGTVHAAGTSFQWLNKNLGLLNDVRSVDLQCKKSSHRVLALQAIGGLGAPRWDYQTPTVYWGLTAQTRPADLVRAVAEAIAFLIADIVSAIRQAGLSIEKIHASGGLARINYLVQFESDLLQHPIARLQDQEATALGVAALAAEAAGIPWARLMRKAKSDKLFQPKMKAVEASKLLSIWKLFVETQQKLGAEFRRLEL